MGLSPREQEGCWKILDYLGVSDLISLYETVAKRKTNLRDKAELIQGIIGHSKSAEELLNRRKTCKEFILKYLSTEGIFMYTTNTKPQLIEKVLKHWAETDYSMAMLSNVTMQYLPPVTQPRQESLHANLSEISVLINDMSLNRQDYSMAMPSNVTVQSLPPVTQPRQESLHANLSEISVLINDMSLNPQTRPQGQSSMQATRPKPRASPPKSKIATVSLTVSLSTTVSGTIAESSQTPHVKVTRKLKK